MRKRFIITLDIGKLPFELYGKNYNEINVGAFKKSKVLPGSV